MIAMLKKVVTFFKVVQDAQYYRLKAIKNSLWVQGYGITNQ